MFFTLHFDLFYFTLISQEAKSFMNLVVKALLLSKATIIALSICYCLFLKEVAEEKFDKNIEVRVEPMRDHN